MTTASWRLDGPGELASLRERSTATLTDAGATRDHVQKVVLALTELATNALRHASGPHRIVIAVEDGFTILRVGDGGGGHVAVSATASEEGGYGLQVVDALAQAWGTVPTDSGKEVWALLVDGPDGSAESGHDGSPAAAGGQAPIDYELVARDTMRRLDESHERMQIAQRLTHFGTFDLDLMTGELRFSDELHRICGLDPEREQIASITDILPILDTEGVERVPEVIAAAADSLDPIEAEFTLLRPDGERAVLEAFIESITDESGRRTALRGTAVDVTASRHILSDLLANREALEEAQRLAQLGSWQYDWKTGAAYWSPQMFALFGRDPADGPTPMSAWAQWIHPDDEAMVQEALDRSLHSRSGFVFEARLRRADGTEVFVSVHGEPVLDDDGMIVAAHGTVQDLTARRLAELALAESEAARAAEHASIDALQRSVLPTALPSGHDFGFAARYEPAGHETLFGGDWYDAFAIGDGRIAIALGDVAGHGIDSAGMMVQLRNATRAYLVEEPSPAATLAALDLLVRRLYADELATMLLAVYDPGAATVSIARAGHPHPVVHEPGDRARLLEIPGGLPIGAGHARGPDYRETQLPLTPGTRLVLYSDGCIEQRGRSFADGITGLLALIDTSTGLDELCDRIVALGATMVEDDRCVLALRHGS